MYLGRCLRSYNPPLRICISCGGGFYSYDFDRCGRCAAAK